MSHTKQGHKRLIIVPPGAIPHLAKMLEYVIFCNIWVDTGNDDHGRFAARALLMWKRSVFAASTALARWSHGDGMCSCKNSD